MVGHDKGAYLSIGKVTSIAAARYPRYRGEDDADAETFLPRV
jgi:hypothetical protein